MATSQFHKSSHISQKSFDAPMWCFFLAIKKRKRKEYFAKLAKEMLFVTIAGQMAWKKVTCFY